MFLTAACWLCWSCLDQWNKFQLVLINSIPLIYLLVSKHKTLCLYRRHSNQYVAAVTITDLLSLRPKQFVSKMSFQRMVLWHNQKRIFKTDSHCESTQGFWLEPPVHHWGTTTKKTTSPHTPLHIYADWLPDMWLKHSSVPPVQYISVRVGGCT